VALHKGIRAAIVTLSALGLGLGAAASGCTSDEDAAASGDGINVCPTSLQEVGTARCHEPLSCNIHYPCGAYLSQSVACSCVGNHFECKDTMGAPVDPRNPQCVPTGSANDKECPAAKGNGQLCKTAGLLCTYASTTICPQTGSAGVDVCQCRPDPEVDGNVVFRYTCEPKSCSTTLAAGPRDAQSDAADVGPG